MRNEGGCGCGGGGGGGDILGVSWKRETGSRVEDGILEESKARSLSLVLNSRPKNLQAERIE